VKFHVSTDVLGLTALLEDLKVVAFLWPPKGDSTSYEYRPIDDCTGSGLNPCTGFSEQMRMHGLETLFTTSHNVRKKFAGWGISGEPVFAKGDHDVR